MDHEPSGGSPSSSSGSSQRKARKRPWNSDEDPPSLGSETSSRSPAHSDSSGSDASLDQCSTSNLLSLLEEYYKALSQYSESSTEDSVAPRGRHEEQAGPISLSTMKNLDGPFTGATLDFRLPCTATEGTTCQIVHHLSAWNEVLCLVCWELREMPGSSRKLSLVFFREPSQWYSSSHRAHLVALLAYQLLKTHHCVAHVELDISLFESHHEILSDALRGSPSSITSVKLTISGLISGDDLATAALSLPHLQELEVTGYRGYRVTQDSATLVARISTFLQTTSSLTALRVSPDCPQGLSSEDIFKALGQNCSLKELMLPSRLIAEAPPSAQAMFTEWLTNSASLTSLIVAGEWGYCALQKCILRALLRNTSIVAVGFKCAESDQADIQLLSKIFEQNKILRSFKLSYESDLCLALPSSLKGLPDKADCDRCLKALLENHSLEEVALPINVWGEHHWKELFEALPAKRNLKRVSVEVLRRAPAPFLAKLCAALTETGADEKVSFNSSFTEKEFDERFTCKAFSSVRLDADDRNRAAVHGILERMASLGHITSLHLDFDMEYELNGVPHSALATFLGATRTLKTLTLSTSEDTLLFDCQNALMDSLAANTSLRELRINVYDTGKDFSAFSEPLADIINGSRNISRVRFEVDCRECAFFRRLLAGIRDNYTLLSVGSYGYILWKVPKRAWFKVWDVTVRNCGLLTGAADFARGARLDRRCALALERMHGHPELVEEVARLEQVDQARAAAMVRDGLRSIEGMHAFMRLAGVVKERVSCNVSTDGSTQLDALNEDCWRALRQYLKLYEIRDSTEGSLAQ